ncbi:hypothetical protein UYSO10_3033 [Kosakonia radicincitans]|nr:hypothetical protein UYSO10_3033 [Kosakonia radicincitans]
MSDIEHQGGDQPTNVGEIYCAGIACTRSGCNLPSFRHALRCSRRTTSHATRAR